MWIKTVSSGWILKNSPMVNLKDFAVNLLMILFNARFNALGLRRFRCCWVSIGICCGCLEPQPSHSTVRYYSHPSAYGRGGLVTSHLPVTRDSSTYINNLICFSKIKATKTYPASNHSLWSVSLLLLMYLGLWDSSSPILQSGKSCKQKTFAQVF